jgi:hypothetical protein
MGEQRRRGGRGRSGRGGRIPRKGEPGGPTGGPDESFVSFPLEVTSPIIVPSALDERAVEETLRRTLDRERQQAAVLGELAEKLGEPALSEIRGQVERHRDQLEQLGRDLGADVAGGAAPQNGGTDLMTAASEQYLTRLGWVTLHRVAHAAGDRRIDRVVASVLRDKDRHALVLEELALRHATRGLFRELE